MSSPWHYDMSGYPENYGAACLVGRETWAEAGGTKGARPEEIEGLLAEVCAEDPALRPE